MSFTGGGKRLLNPDMQLPITERKPHSTTSPERLGLLEFGQADQSAVEPACLRLAGQRGGNLHMVQEGWISHRVRTLPSGTSPDPTNRAVHPRS
jgi:hypothetical protein